MFGFPREVYINAATLWLGFSGPAYASGDFLGKIAFGRVFFRLEFIRHFLGIFIRDPLDCGSASTPSIPSVSPI